MPPDDPSYIAARELDAELSRLRRELDAAQTELKRRKDADESRDSWVSGILIVLAVWLVLAAMTADLHR